VIVAALILGIAFGIWRLAPRMAPVPDGVAAEFWNDATGLNLGFRAPETVGRMYPPAGGWYFYWRQGFERAFYFKVARRDVAAGFPEVVAKLDAAQQAGTLPPAVSVGFRRWKQAGPEAAGDYDLLLTNIRGAWFDALDAQRQKGWREAETDFQEHWNRANRYWLNGLLEFLYLSTVVVFAAWPWLRRKGAWARSIHLGLAPLLLFVPYFLGYAQWAFAVGPSGGILYPWVIGLTPRFSLWTSLDDWFYRVVRQVLQPLSQDTGSAVGVSGGVAGPVSIIPTCFLFAGLAVGWHYIWVSRYRQVILFGLLGLAAIFLLGPLVVFLAGIFS
jgi:hypothetical protein